MVGLGVTGKCCVKFLLQKNAEVSVSDSADAGSAGDDLEQGVKYFLGGRSALAFDGADMVVTSPGVADSSVQLKIVLERKIPLVSEIELFSWFCKSPIIAVTGTNGKTTTTVLISRLMEKAGFSCTPAGNIGLPLTCLPESAFNGAGPVVCEISSFQLEHTFSFSPFISVVLNIAPDHLDRYENFESYAEAKKNIVLNQKQEDYAILNYDCPNTRKLAGHTRARVLWIGKDRIPGEGVFIQSGKIKGSLESKKIELSVEDAGFQNLYNVMALAACALVYGVSGAALSDVLKSFKGLPHRREFVAEISGVSFYNDSKATNAEAFLDGLKALGKDIILISGGRDKGIDFTPLRGEVSRRVKSMILMGEASQKLRECFGGVVLCRGADDMRSAVETAFEGSSAGEKIVLLPGCSSFDMFEDYRHRGDAFVSEVMRLKKKISGDEKN